MLNERWKMNNYCQIIKWRSEKNIYTKDNKGNLYGPIFSNLGIPYGSPLSPILFNL